jgi:hypothetical protein
MSDDLTAKLAEALALAQDAINNAGLGYVISKAQFHQISDLSENDGKSSLSASSLGKTLDVCCSFWDCRSSPCKCIQWENC